MESNQTVLDVSSVNWVKLQSWFTVGAARRIAKLKRVQHLVVEDRRIITGVVTPADLEAADPDAPIASCMVSTTPIPGHCTIEDAWEKIIDAGVDFLPVFEGALLAGVVTREALRRAQHRQPWFDGAA